MFKRSIAVLGSTAVVAFLVAPQAQAADPDLESYGAGASATALVLSVGGQELTFSGTSAAVATAPTAENPDRLEAAADGQAVATPIFSSDGAPVSTDGALAEGLDCVLDEALPAPIDLAGLEISCVHTSAEVADGSPVASSEADQILLEAISAELVGTAIETVLRPLLTELLAALAPALDALDAILPVTPSLNQLITLLLAGLDDGDTLATITVGETSATATDVVGEASAQGVTIELLPELVPGGLLSVVVGDSFATAAYNPATGEIDLDGQAAFLSVDTTGLGLILTALLGDIQGVLDGLLPDLDVVTGPLFATILSLVTTADTQIEDIVNVTVDQLACPDSPLSALLCFQAGGVNELDAAGLEAHGFTYGDGTRGIEAEVLGLNVLDETLVLGIGQASAGANAVPAVAPPVAPPATTPPAGNLPRTGAESALPLTLALFAAAALGLAMVRRTRTV